MLTGREGPVLATEKLTKVESAYKFRCSPAAKGRCWHLVVAERAASAGVSMLTGREGPVLARRGRPPVPSGRVSMLTGREGPVLDDLALTAASANQFRCSPAAKGRCWDPALRLRGRRHGVSMLTGREGPVLARISSPVVRYEPGFDAHRPRRAGAGSQALWWAV